jgi:hypothetical protein
MTKKDDKHPEPPRDDELADAISKSQNMELIEQEAREQATYWITLFAAGVDSDSATELTKDWTEYQRIMAIDDADA